MKVTRPLIELAMRQCGDKRCFPTREQAVRFMHAMRWAGKVGNNVSAYQCSFCGHWHWGHIIRRVA